MKFQHLVADRTGQKHTLTPFEIVQESIEFSSRTNDLDINAKKFQKRGDQYNLE